jgi:hypothetical protein
MGFTDKVIDVDGPVAVYSSPAASCSSSSIIYDNADITDDHWPEPTDNDSGFQGRLASSTQPSERRQSTQLRAPAASRRRTSCRRQALRSRAPPALGRLLRRDRDLQGAFGTNELDERLDGVPRQLAGYSPVRGRRAGPIGPAGSLTSVVRRQSDRACLAGPALERDAQSSVPDNGGLMVQVVAFLRAYNQRKKLNPSPKLAAGVSDRDRSFRCSGPARQAARRLQPGASCIRTPGIRSSFRLREHVDRVQGSDVHANEPSRSIRRCRWA